MLFIREVAKALTRAGQPAPDPRTSAARAWQQPRSHESLNGFLPSSGGHPLESDVQARMEHEMFFGRVEYSPTTVRGQELLAHELAHTVQNSGRIGFHAKFAVGKPNAPSEFEAEGAARQVIRNPASGVVAPVALTRGLAGAELRCRENEQAGTAAGPRDWQRRAHPGRIRVLRTGQDRAQHRGFMRPAAWRRDDGRCTARVRVDGPSAICC